MIIDKIVSIAIDRVGTKRLNDIRIGLGYLVVELDDGSLGCSYIFLNELGHGCSHLEEAGDLIGMEARELLQWALDMRKSLKSSIGIAVLDALTDMSISGISTDMDVIDEVSVSSRDIVGMIGYFRPMIEPLREKAKELRVFERQSVKDSSFIYPDWAEERLLADCDVVIVTGTSMINKTTDQILRYCKNARELILTGPTVLVYPEAYEGTGVTGFGSALIPQESKEKVFEMISQGGGGMQLFKYFIKYTLMVK